jgi:hypothetical protein
MDKRYDLEMLKLSGILFLIGFVFPPLWAFALVVLAWGVICIIIEFFLNLTEADIPEPTIKMLEDKFPSDWTTTPH